MSMTAMREDNWTLLRDLRSLLTYQACSGVGHYPVTADIEAFLASSFVSDSSPPEGTRTATEEKPARSSQSRQEPALPENPGTIGEIDREIRACRSCGLAERRIVPAGGSGGEKVKLFIVGSWLVTWEDDRCGSQQECIFGAEEDEMVKRMTGAINLSREEVFVSNIIKCGVGPQVQPQVEHIDACISYLERQITATRPDIICVMGMAAARTLLKIRRPLSSIRGKVYTYRLGEKMSIPVIPTYHPSFLLKNPEMKKATWADLQLIEKKLAGRKLY